MTLKRVELTIQKYNMICCNDRIVIALSGGPDSVALAYLLYKLKKKWRLYLHLAHLNHQLRGDESDHDSRFVENLAKKLGIGLTIENKKVKDYAKEKKLSIEEAARLLRYEFLAEVAKQNSAFKIALGHTKDDQAETVLMRFLRGSGISGLRAIPAKRNINGVQIIRPLIETERKEIIKYLFSKNISYRIDSSNLQNSHLRNRIRNTLMPFLEKDFNANIKDILVTLAETFSDDFDYLESAGKSKFKAVCADSSAKHVALKIDKFCSLHKALQKIVARSAIKELKGDTRKIEYRHWKELEDLTFKRPKNSIVDLPSEISVIKSGEKIIFYKRNSK